MDKKRLLLLIAGMLLAMAILALGFALGRFMPVSEEEARQVLGEQVKNQKEGGCTTIQDGVLLTSDGVVITTGFDEWGYNYQGKIFNGGYCNAYRDAAWCQEYKDIELVMKWNEAWLSNKDCDGDGLLDRHYGDDAYIGSGAWETNAMRGEYEEDGKTCHWNSFTKIIAVPEDAVLTGGTWFASSGEEIGPSIWGEFAIILDIFNDSCGGDSGKWHNVVYHSEAPIGFGVWGAKGR